MKVLASGRFNIIHPGHVYFLEQAKALGTELVVVVASDRTIRTQKKTLFAPQADRCAMVAALRCVDRVRKGYPIAGVQGYTRILTEEKPDIIALGYDQPIEKLRALTKDSGIKIVRIKRYKRYQTKKIKERG